MDFVTPLYHTLQAQATLDQTAATALDTRALAQMRQQAVQMGAIKMQQMQNTQQALMQTLSGMNAADPSFDASPDDTAVESSRKSVGRLQQQATQARTLAVAVAKAGGDPKVVDQWNDNAANAAWRATQAQRENLAEVKQAASQIASIASAVTPENFAASYQQMARVDPKLTQTLAFDRDDYGAPTFGPKTQQTLKVLANAGRTAEQQATDAIKVTAEQDRVAKEARLVDDQRRKRDETDADIALKQAHAALYKAQTEQVGKPKANANAGSKPSTGPQVKAAKAAVQAEFPDAEFDTSIDRFAADVADRANKIRADAKAGGEDVGMDDARDQALSELKGYVTNRTKVLKEGVDLPLLGNVGRKTETLKTYTRSGASKAAQSGETAPEIKDQAAYDALPKGAPYLFNGKRGVKQ